MKAPSSSIWPLLRKCCTDRSPHTLEGASTTSATVPGEFAISTDTAATQAMPEICADRRTSRGSAEPIPLRYAPVRAVPLLAARDAPPTSLCAR